MIIGPPTEALRLRSPGLLYASLLGLLVEGEADWAKDERDLMVAMAPYHDCARRLDLDPATLFDDAAREGPSGLAEVVREFGHRNDVTPTAFGFTVEEQQEGLAYETPDADPGWLADLEAWLDDDHGAEN